MTKLKQTLEDVYTILSAIPVTGDAVDCMAAARKKLRDAWQLLEKEEEQDHG